MAPSKQVSFDSIEVVEHSMILGDHPACRIGPPVQMSWNVQRRDCYSVDEFEETRSPYRRRSTDDLVLTSAQRRRLIIAARVAEEDDDQSESSSLSGRSTMSETDILLQHMSEKTDELVQRMQTLDEGFFMMGIKRRHRRRRETTRKVNHIGLSTRSRGAMCSHAIRPAGLRMAGTADVSFGQEN